ncbi:MAG TPA: hypothetical protein VFR37_21345 [Longimicrobium sp.]|nr:hypothetical protein [Longimicrobium sp.]
MSNRTLSDHDLAHLAAPLRDANLAFAARYPGESGRRQPVHTVYGGAQLFRAESTQRLGDVAVRALEEYAPDAAALAEAIGLEDAALAETVFGRVVEKLRREPVEDFRIDFEDGYGNRPDPEEDADAVRVAGELARGMEAGTLPPFIGMRIKTLNEELHGRAIRTLDLLLTELARQTGGRLPENWIITVPKVTVPQQVAFFVGVVERLERSLGLAEGTLKFELMVEVPQAIIGADGRCALPAFLDAAGGRMTAAHFGTYDYTAGVGVTASQQRMRHAACDFARHVMQVSFAGTGIWLSDGSTTVMPVPVHRPAAGERLTAEQVHENRESVHGAWRMHYDDIRHSLVHGFYQGWDLHPAQLPTRYAAVFAFFLEGLELAAQRLRNFVEKAAQATLVGDVFDDAATGQGLLNYFARGINCGALTEDEARGMTGLTLEELRGRSFLQILRTRQG